MTDLVFGVTADADQAQRGLSATKQSLQNLRQDVQQFNRAADAGGRTLQEMGQRSERATRVARGGVEGLRTDLKSMNAALDAVNDNFQQLGPEAKAELAVVESAVNSLRRSFRRAHGDIDRLETISGRTSREVVKDATLMQRAVSGIGRAAQRAHTRLVALGTGVRGGASRLRGGASILGVGAGVGLLSGGLALGGLGDRADELTLSRARLGLLPDSNAPRLPNLRRVPAEFRQQDETQRSLAESAEDLDRKWQRLFDTAQDLRVPITSLSDLTFQLGLSTEALGSQAGKTDRIIELVSKNLTIAGTGAEAARNGLRQFTQAMQRGTVQAEEFNSIQESIPTILQAVARGLGLTFAQLRQEMLDGNLSSERFAQGLIKNGQEIDRQFEQLPRTARQARVQLSNTLDGILDDLNKASPISAELVSLYDTLREALQKPTTETFLSSAISDVQLIISDITKLIALIQDPSIARASDLLGTSPPRPIGRDPLSIDRPSSALDRRRLQLGLPTSSSLDISRFFQSAINVPLSQRLADRNPPQTIPPRLQSAGTVAGIPLGQSVPLGGELPIQNAAARQQELQTGVTAGLNDSDLTQEAQAQSEFLGQIIRGSQVQTDTLSQTNSKLDGVASAVNDSADRVVAAQQQTDRRFLELREAFFGSGRDSGQSLFGGSTTLQLSIGGPITPQLPVDPNIQLQRDLQELEAQREVLELSPRTSTTDARIASIDSRIRQIELAFAEQRLDQLQAPEPDRLIGIAPTSVSFLGGFAAGGSGRVPGSGPQDSVLALAKLSPDEPFAFGDDGIRRAAAQIAGGAGGDTINNLTINAPITIEGNVADEKAVVDNIAAELATVAEHFARGLGELRP